MQTRSQTKPNVTELKRHTKAVSPQQVWTRQRLSTGTNGYHASAELPDGQTFVPAQIKLVGVVCGDLIDLDAILSAVSERLRERGAKVCGLIQSNGTRERQGAYSSMRVLDASGKERTDIRDARGACARGCRLNWQKLTEACRRVEQELDDGAQMLIVNRFGRAESTGHGLRNAITTAMLLDVPTLVGVRSEYLSQWQDFHGGLGCSVNADKLDVDHLISQVLAGK